MDALAALQAEEGLLPAHPTDSGYALQVLVPDVQILFTQPAVEWALKNAVHDQALCPRTAASPYAIGGRASPSVFLRGGVARVLNSALAASTSRASVKLETLMHHLPQQKFSVVVVLMVLT